MIFLFIALLHLKKFLKPLDKYKKIVYNKDTIKRKEQNTMPNEILIAKLYTANKRLEYCKSAKATAEEELAYANGIMTDVLNEAKASSLSPAEILNAMNYGKI